MSRKSTSGGVWMLGKHCIKTWSASQGAVALSSAEAEFYGMIEGGKRTSKSGGGKWDLRDYLMLFT